MSSIHFVGGEKGGVGKSVVARLIAQYFIDQGREFAGIDADGSYGALQRHYADFTQSVALERPESADSIMDRALGADRSVLVDLPAQSVRALSHWIEGADVLRYARELGVDLTFWFVTDGGYGSARALETLVDLFDERLNYVAVKNHGRGRDFRQFEQSTALQRVFQLGAQSMALAELEPQTMYAIDQGGFSFWAAVNNTSGAGALTPMQRQRTRLWLENCYSQLDALAALGARSTPDGGLGHG